MNKPKNPFLEPIASRVPMAPSRYMKIFKSQVTRWIRIVNGAIPDGPVKYSGSYTCLEENKIIEAKDEMTLRKENQMPKVYSVLPINISDWLTNFQTTL